jgi:hypothetical protein
MRRSRRAWALAVVLVLNIVLAVLLTPLGFESRPTAALMPPGYLAIGAVFAGLALDVVALFLIFFRRVGLAARLAMAGCILFLFPNVVDQTGVFFLVPIPPVVRMLEYVFIVVLLLTLVLAWTLRHDGETSSG